MHVSIASLHNPGDIFFLISLDFNLFTQMQKAYFQTTQLPAISFLSETSKIFILTEHLLSV